ncbi:MAG: electron transfer flavoprotein subunit beta/FixA family protein [Clostridium sp.]
MKILVCVKQVPEGEVKFDEKTGLIIRENNEMKINPIDLFAIEEALALKDKFGGEVLVLTMGAETAKEVIVEAISLGVDDGVLISDKRFKASDILATSRTLESGIEKMGDFDLVLCGRESIDGSTSLLPIELGERLKMPTITNVEEIVDIKNNVAEVFKVEDENRVRQKVKLPALMSILEYSNEPRFPDYVLLLKGEKAEIKVLGLEDFSDKDEENYGLSGSESIVLRTVKEVKEVTMDFNVNSNTSISEKHTGSNKELSEKLENKLKEIKFL